MDATKILTRSEQSLLVFFETCAVDAIGKIRTKHMNEKDFEIAHKWNETGFIKFGRIVHKDIQNDFTHWCELSNDAWECAMQVRKARAERGLQGRVYMRTEEKDEQTE